MSKTAVIDKPKAINFVLCTCYQKEGYYCKNWNGKGNVPKVTEAVKDICKLNKTNPDTCEFLVNPIERKGRNWIYDTIAGSPVTVTEIVEERHSVKVKERIKKVIDKKVESKTCVDCNDVATYMIEGYRPIYLCKLHAEIAKADGNRVIEITEENVDA